MKRSGLMRATTKVLRYGLTKPFAFSFFTTSATLSSSSSSISAVLLVRLERLASGSSENSVSRRTNGL